MRLPNGFGNVSKLPGNRRKPYRARITSGWDYDELGGKHQKYQTVGYFATESEALIALSNYHQNPYDIDSKKVTFSEVYEKWSDEHYRKISQSNIRAYKSVYKLCTMLFNMPFNDIKRAHLQGVVDSCEKNYPVLNKLKVLFSQLYEFALQNEICEKNYSKFVDVSQYKDRNPDALTREPFTFDEINLLWKLRGENTCASIVLMLIYSGVRIGELLDLKKSDVNLSEKWFYIRKAKTASGIRYVPISDKVLPLFEEWYFKSDCEHLIHLSDGKSLKYNSFLYHLWNPFMREISSLHHPHDTRHTCISMLVSAGVNDKIIKRIVGHKGQSVTDVVYTHFDMQELIDSINKI